MRSALVHGRTNGALVLIASERGDDRATARRLEVFARELLPQLRTYFP